MNILESILQAFESVRSNTLRTILTLLSISIGIFSIIGAGSAVATLDSAVNTQLVAMGENSFMIRRTPTINMGNSWRKYRNRKDDYIKNFWRVVNWDYVESELSRKLDKTVKESTTAKEFLTEAVKSEPCSTQDKMASKLLFNTNGQ